MRLTDIKKIRKQIGMTQSDLAKTSGVSQSLIAKVESGRLDPAYSKAMKIIDTLKTMKKREELSAKDLMHLKIISVSPDDKISRSIEKMKKYEISQMPVISEGKAIGRVSESIIIDALMSDKGEKVSDVMEDSAPIVSKDTAMPVIADLLKFYQLVLVSDRGRLAGIITRSDILRNV